MKFIINLGISLLLNLYFNEVHQVLVLDIVTTADDEHDRVLERCAVLRCHVAAFQKLRIEVQVVVDVCVASAFHQLIGDLCDWKILKEDFE